MSTSDVPDPSSLSLDELRRLRERLQHEDDAVSYARRVAQARLDLVMKVREQRALDGSTGLETDWSDPDHLRDVLAQHLTAGDARPPRPTMDLSDEAPARELEELCASNGIARLGELTLDELDALADAIRDFETRASIDRRERFDQLDALTGELVRRYRASQAGTA